MGYPVLVPRRDDNGRRDALWAKLKHGQWDDWPVYEGYHTEGAFNRSAAINAAAKLAGVWSVAVIADADTCINPQTLDSAIDIAEQTGKLVIPHSRWVNVEEDETDDFIASQVLHWNPDRIKYSLTVSSILVVPRGVWNTVNGFDERFVGWGWEDTAFMHAVDTLTGGHIRLEGDVYHLAHDRPEADTNRQSDPYFLANSNHYRNMYKRITDPAQMRRVVTKNH